MIHLGGCERYKARTGVTYECCTSCHYDMDEMDTTPIYREFEDGYYCCCCASPNPADIQLGESKK